MHSVCPRYHCLRHPSAEKTNWKVHDSAISEHYRMITTFSLNQEPFQESKNSRNFRKANWFGFTQEQENPLNLKVNGLRRPR
ncbi:hypothetical protein TNIN_445711 [Trichonephila inaurata madagascariensis]|uniref:Uncharacterized protein n=1 Tax=Trichonephila inaurata madagascariensis TaxID=2747483 RepID=A0A8X6XET6_9ARAC|nr:hypothetical protein TNIN_445711 [Trichonephila inaurata madagascariensis]